MTQRSQRGNWFSLSAILAILAIFLISVYLRKSAANSSAFQNKTACFAAGGFVFPCG
jgi:uncharacterized membrane protein YjjP (DUF1212 family)